MEEMVFETYEPDQRIRDSFKVDMKNGKIYWKKISKYHSRKLGKEAGLKTLSRGKYYWIIQLDGRKFKRSHLIYFFEHNKLPKLIDHIDGNSLNDKPENLRDTTNLVNSRNHKKRNIRLIKKTRKYQVRLGKIYSKNVDTLEEAEKIYDKKRLELWRT